MNYELQEKYLDKLKLSGFIAEQVVDAEVLNETEGAGDGRFSPTYIAKHYFGIEPNCADILLYCFRRFGYPVFGCDGYKDVAAWTITTPMPGVFLYVKPGGLPFGYVVNKSFCVLDHMTKKNNAWDARLYEWAKKEKDTILAYHFMWGCSDEKRKDFENAAEKWLVDKYGEKKKTFDDPDDSKLFWQDMEDLYNQLADEYKNIDPEPENWCQKYQMPFEKIDRNKPFWEKLPRDDIVSKINEALSMAIVDMLRPTNIRDGLINILGSYYGELDVIDYSKHTGRS